MLSSVSHDSCATVSCIPRSASVSFKMFRAYRMITVRIILSSTLLQTACKGQESCWRCQFVLRPLGLQSLHSLHASCVIAPMTRDMQVQKRRLKKETKQASRSEITGFAVRLCYAHF